MPNTIHYPHVIPFISQGKINAIKSTFGNNLSDRECYGIYIWSQKASSAIYPLLQQLEVTLRNSIDKEATKLIGQKWWDNVYTDTSKSKHGDFIHNINKAKKRYENEFKKKTPSMANTKIIAPHDDIIAHTDFYTWQAVLSDAFHTQSRSEASRALWPRLTYRVLKGLDRSKDEGTARIDFLNELNEIRNYRNRLSHNDCIWIKIHSKNLQSAVETIREKINKIEGLIKTINPQVHLSLTKWGSFYHAKRICSQKEAELHLGKGIINSTTDEMNTILDQLYALTADGKLTGVVKRNTNNIAFHKF
ncbi:Abi family protein [Salmonella enterica]|uniref:Abi family protein n=1 Tax=Salmonella enterica TaxID=28901 RepID=UPI002238FE19|nr:Abi family protein [Salmonella enterica]MCW6849659.1 Abi family protein [Salmonella enterica subsp. enterica serovar Reading]MCW6854301.1 Abi family protein [Salmonella enterica subsp. enterica serovar Montevideo]MCW6881437.1 Abi family protein [Salmonella enterica subsp. enterica serovar Fillmore]MDJ5735141.1 Abi family protein [Salmonella enterica]MDJ7515452.1 Abi family protein [Salmonella enterica]